MMVHKLEFCEHVLSSPVCIHRGTFSKLWTHWQTYDECFPCQSVPYEF